MASRSAQSDLLVLGAGSSKPYNLPTAAGLAADIVRSPQVVLSSLSLQQARSWGHEEEQDLHDAEARSAEDFARRFGKSHSESIDEFLEHRPGLAEQGKRQIAARLLDVESNVVETSATREEWIGWLLSRLLRTYKSPTQFPFRVISFNYDRLFEYALASALSSRFDRLLAHCWEDVVRFGVFHPYGVLERDIFRTSKTAFDLRHDADAVLHAATGIRVIGEERESADDRFREARRWVATADTIVFLGFGFDPTNLTRLGITRNSAFARRRSEIKVYATAHGLEEQEVRTAKALLLAGSQDQFGGPDEGCLTFLRRTFDWAEAGWLT